MRFFRFFISVFYAFSIAINAALLWQFLPIKKYIVIANQTEKKTQSPLVVISPTEMPIPTVTPTPTIIIPTPTVESAKVLFSETHTINYEDLKSEINKITAGSPGTWGIVVNDLTNNNSLMINENEIFHGASTTKIITAVVILQKIEKGEINFDVKINGQTIKELLTKMINQSDNDAWGTLNTIATHDDRQNLGINLGMSSLNIDDNKLSPLDMKILLRYLYKGQTLMSDDRSFLFLLMQNTQDETRIPNPIPLNIPVIHKSGNIDDVFHDVSIVFYDRPYILIVMGKGTNAGEGRKIIQDVSRTVFTYFQTAN